MQITVIGSIGNLEEIQRKFGASHTYQRKVTPSEISEECDVVFDFRIAEEPSSMAAYGQLRIPVFLNTVMTTLSGIGAGRTPALCFGFCGMPTFVDRPLLEVSLLKPEDGAGLSEVCAGLKTDYRIVADKIGLVTPRVICMIINEAFYAVEDGTATREDIDLAMKLGTNYPWGPFEWCARIGAGNVTSLLKALENETRDMRYRCSALLETEQPKK